MTRGLWTRTLIMGRVAEVTATKTCLCSLGAKTTSFDGSHRYGWNPSLVLDGWGPWESPWLYVKEKASNGPALLEASLPNSGGWGSQDRTLRGRLCLALWGWILGTYPLAEASHRPLITWVLYSHRTESKCPAERDGYTDEKEKITGCEKGKGD